MLYFIIDFLVVAVLLERGDGGGDIEELFGAADCRLSTGRGSSLSLLTEDLRL